jgi:hypothetical protein
MPQAVQFPLKIGVTTHAPVYADTAPRQIRRYRVRAEPYEVTLVYPGYDEVVGTCEVVKTGAQSFAVRPKFAIAFASSEARFWGGFSVDESGTATLENVYLVPTVGH